MDKYGTGQDPYCYPGSFTLRNRLNIRDGSLLAQAEQDLSEIAAMAVAYGDLKMEQEWVDANVAAVICDYAPLEAVFQRCVGQPIAD